jgi:ligand-binding sensor protein
MEGKGVKMLTLAEPLDTERISLTDLFQVEELQKIQDTFAQATKVASIITLPDGTPVTQPSNFCRLCDEIVRKTERGRINCFCSDAIIGRRNDEGPTIQICLSGGLWDAGASITVNGQHIGNWLVGQVKNELNSRSFAIQRKLAPTKGSFARHCGKFRSCRWRSSTTSPGWFFCSPMSFR